MYRLPPETVAANLAMRLYDGLLPEKECQLMPAAEFIISGRLQLSYGGELQGPAAFCRFIVTPRWHDKIPRVICEETWRAPGSDEWHIADSGELCVDYHLYWRDVISDVNRKHGLCPTADFAAAWLQSSTAELLYRHLMRHRGTFTEWRPEWDYWPHSKKAALAEYKRMRRAQTRRVRRDGRDPLSQS
jgi:hypothetical protein